MKSATETPSTKSAIEMGPVVAVLPATLLDAAEFHANQCRTAAYILLGISLFRFMSIEGLMGIVSSCIFLCMRGRQTARTTARRAIYFRPAAMAVALLAGLGSVMLISTSAVLIPQVGSRAESLCVAREPPQTRTAIVRAPSTVAVQAWSFGKPFASACTGRMLSTIDTETAVSSLEDTLARLAPVPDKSGEDETPHQMRARCHRFANTVKMAGSVTFLLLLFAEMAHGLAAVYAFRAAGRLVDFINAAGPNVM